MYRTAVDLSKYFNVPLSVIVEDTIPTSLWHYCKRSNVSASQCVGRDWELNQLELLFLRSKTERVSVFVHGKKGVGKSHLIKFFVTNRARNGDNALYISDSDSTSYLSSFICHLLKISSNSDENQIRNKLTSIIKSPLVYLYLLNLMGVSLNDSERSALHVLSEERKAEITTLSVMVIIGQLVEQNISIIAFDELQELNCQQLSFIQLLVFHSKEQSVFFILSATNTHRFYVTPSWLQEYKKINLLPLIHSEAVNLATSLTIENSQELSPTVIRQLAIRASGNPLYIHWEAKCRSIGKVSLAFIDMLKNMMMPLTQTEIDLLFFLARQGFEVKESIIESYLSKNRNIGVTAITALIMSGFIEPTFQSYSFQHPLLRDVINTQQELFTDKRLSIHYPRLKPS
ncbi:AAA family ATPase [Vibrio sp. V38_P2S17PM301]|uniref:AAA family ATPase n=1 Tax=Vibrio sp. V38_P2S17PM301 TaxID=1938689 RepID=UPI001361901F|nr:AAA family ATPase [Vibrio sp. V36_P2S2PM302]NAX27776.1 AAA family ATPase [Vibrio sp. V38_P2S17PM301]